MINSLKEFYKTWQHESQSTIKVFQHLTDESLSTRVYEGGRTLGKLANHIVETLSELPSKLCLGISEKHAHYVSVNELIEVYKKDSAALIEAIKEKWTDDSLHEKHNMYGEEWKNNLSLWVLITHQIHHRGQMTVLMRQAGLKVPGIYGPAKEEWEAMGIPAME